MQLPLKCGGVLPEDWIWLVEFRELLVSSGCCDHLKYDSLMVLELLEIVWRILRVCSFYSLKGHCWRQGVVWRALPHSFIRLTQPRPRLAHHPLTPIRSLPLRLSYIKIWELLLEKAHSFSQLFIGALGSLKVKNDFKRSCG